MVSRGQNHRELVQRCRQGDRKAWMEFVEHCTPAVYRLAFRMLGRQSDAEDACQEVFLRVCRSLESYDQTRALGPWISRITYNVCLRRLQNAASRAKVSDESVATLPNPHFESMNPEAQAAGREAASHLEAAIADLSAQDRAMLLMRYRDGFTEAEVAEATGMKIGNVKTRIFRARKRLRATLQPVIRGTQS